MNLITFDLETQQRPDDWDRLERIPIYCGSALITLDTPHGPAAFLRIYFAGMSRDDGETFVGLDDLVEKVEDGRVVVSKEMTEEEVEWMFDDLLLLSQGLEAPGRTIPVAYGGPGPFLFTWTGTDYDFPVVASNIPARRCDIAALAKRSFDPCFQFIRTLGFPIGLSKVTEQMLGEGKDMDGAQVSSLWPLDAGEVLRCNADDSRLTREAVLAIKAEQEVRWITKRGQPTSRRVTQWRRVENIMNLPEPLRKRWKDYAGQYDLEALTGWMHARSTREERKKANG